VSRPCRISSCSPLRRRPDAATRPTARDVSQRAEPDVRPLGRAVSVFITDRTRRLTGDVPPQHLMCPVALLADGDQTIPQAACLSIPVAGDVTILSHAPRSSSLVRGQGSFLSAFRDRGVPEPTSECAACPSPDGSSAWASAKGGEARWPETGVREVEIPRPSCSSRAQVGCACSRGLQASTRVREASGPKRAPVSSSSPRGPPSLRRPWSFLL
jgi:hypothetical protein